MCIAVFGGLTGFVGRAGADVWLVHKFAALKAPQIVETCMKGACSGRLLFAEFVNKQTRDDAVITYRAAYVQRADQVVWV